MAENEKRADIAQVAVTAFTKASRDCDGECALKDLLCDLMHFSNRHELSFKSELACAERNYKAEIEEHGKVKALE